ncbi:hypothetical protein SESBI_45213, partial [Sesbania bispinosa]
MTKRVRRKSEEERNLGLDDGFEDAVHEENVVNEMDQNVINEMAENVVKERAEKLTPREVFRAPDVEGMDKIDEDYVSDELNSDLDEGYNSEANDKPKYPTFQKEE